MVVLAAGEVHHHKSCSAVLFCLLVAEYLKDTMQHDNMHIPARSPLLSLTSGTVQKLGHAQVTFVVASFAQTPPTETIFIQHFTL